MRTGATFAAADTLDHTRIGSGAAAANNYGTITNSLTGGVLADVSLLSHRSTGDSFVIATTLAHMQIFGVFADEENYGITGREIDNHMVPGERSTAAATLVQTRGSRQNLV